MEWYLNAFRNYATFSGRARRKEFWMFVLFNVIAGIVIGMADSTLGFVNYETGIGMLSKLYGMIVFIPYLALTVRRLHDTGRSGWWVLIYLVPLIGILVLLFFASLEGEAGENQYGKNPKEIDLLENKFKL